MQIEKAIPIPVFAREYVSEYPFAEMGVGDSFLVESDQRSDHRRVRSRSQYYARLNNVRFVTRRVNGGLRVWRVE
jgi:hypothetical protein